MEKKLAKLNFLIFISLVATAFLLMHNISNFFISLIPKGTVLALLNPMDAWNIYFTGALFMATIVYMPIGIVSLYFWGRRALYENERKILKKGILISSGLFVAGALFGTWLYLNYCLPMFMSLSQGLNTMSLWGLKETLVNMMGFGFFGGIMFCSPIVMWAMVKSGLTDLQWLKKNRLKLYFMLFLAIAIVPFTPYDIGGQLICFAPIVSLMEITMYTLRQKKEKLIQVQVPMLNKIQEGC